MTGFWRCFIRPLGTILAMGVLLAAAAMPVMAEEDTVDVRSGLLDAPEKAWWSGSTVAKWKSVRAANQYQVKLYQYGGPEEAVLTVKVAAISYDFAEVMKDGEQYYFMVRSVPKVNEQQIKTASDWTVSAEGDPVIRGITSGKWRNYLEGSRYEMEDGSFAADGWQLIQGQWYYFDHTGYVTVNTWLDFNGRRYYLAEDGKMQTGWLEDNGNWYYFNAAGEMQTGWVNGDKPTEWYYLNSDGTMARDTVIDGYVLDAGGLAQ